MTGVLDQIEANPIVLSGTISPVTIDPGGPRKLFLTPTQNITINVPQAKAGLSLEVIHQQDGTGSRAITWTGTGGCTVVFPGAATGGPATAANQYSYFMLTWPRPDTCLISKVIA